MSPSATYVYALLRAPAAPATLAAPEGLPGFSVPRALDAGDGLWLLAADAPLPEYAAETINGRLEDLSWVSACALAHERVVEHFAAAGTLVPMKLFTLFAADARAVEHLRGERERLVRLLDHVAGCREWGVRVHLDEAAARAAWEAEQGGEDDPGAGGAGTAFLRRKKGQQEGARTLAARARAGAEELFDALAGRARDAVRRAPPAAEAGARLLLDAAFLVQEKDAAGFEEEVGRGAEALLRLGAQVTLTGPWPPYNFAAEGA